MHAEQWQTAVGIDVADHQMRPKCSPLQRSSGRATLYRRPTSVTDEGMSRAWLCTGTGLDVLGFHTLYSLSSSCSSACSERIFCSWGALRGLRQDRMASQHIHPNLVCDIRIQKTYIVDSLASANECVVTTKHSPSVGKRQLALHGLLPRPPMDQTTLKETYLGCMAADMPQSFCQMEQREFPW